MTSTHCSPDANSLTSSEYLKRLVNVISNIKTDQFDKGVELIRESWQAGRQVIVFGNGGSAMTAQHYVTDWNKMIYLATGKPFKGRCLVENMGLITAYSNDISYNDVFVEQLKPVLEPGDLVIGVSGSGNSENVLRAIHHTNENGGITLGIGGYGGGRLRNLAQHYLGSDVDDMQLSEDLHLIFGHIVMRSICVELNRPGITGGH